MSARSAWWALVLLVPAPSIGAYLGLIAMPDSALGKGAWMFAKLWLLVMPVLWHWRVDRQRVRMPRPSMRGMGAAVVTGVLMILIIGGAYWLIGRDWIDPEVVRATMAKTGLDKPMVYILGAIYWCTFNSLAEEYVWRWFVFTRWRRLVGPWSAVMLAGLCFTLHHIIALAAYFDWRVTCIASVGVFGGGVIWSWIYMRYRNIYAAYISHVFADLIIFYIGWTITFS